MIASILKKGKDGARQPRTLFALDCYLLRCFSMDLNENWHGRGPQAGVHPHEIGILKFQTVAVEIGISVYHIKAAFSCWW